MKFVGSIDFYSTQSKCFLKINHAHLHLQESQKKRLENVLFKLEHGILICTILNK